VAEISLQSFHIEVSKIYLELQTYRIQNIWIIGIGNKVTDLGYVSLLLWRITSREIQRGEIFDGLLDTKIFFKDKFKNTQLFLEIFYVIW